jgi:hypothetical protein
VGLLTVLFRNGSLCVSACRYFAGGSGVVIFRYSGTNVIATGGVITR